MAIEKLLVIAAVLSAANAAANNTKTWGDVKLCAANGVLDCHDKCKTNLDTEFQGKIRFCQEDLIHRLFQGFEDCFDKNDLGINNDTACKAMKNRNNMKAVENCVEDVASKSVADLVVKFFVPCVMDSFGLGNSAGGKLPGALKKSEGTWTMSESARYQASSGVPAFSCSAAYAFSLTGLAISFLLGCKRL